MKKQFRSLLAVTLAFVLCLSLWTPAFAADKAEATTIRLAKTEGDGVSVTTNADKAVAIKEKMRVFSGYKVATDKSSFAYLSLDDAKAVKLDSNTKVKIEKQGNKNKVALSTGKLFFNVEKKLAENETLEVKTSNVSMGVRGTVFIVFTVERRDDAGQLLESETMIQMLTGKGTISLTDPETGQIRDYDLTAGGKLEVIDYRQDHTGEIRINELAARDIPSFAIGVIKDDPKLAEQIAKESGITLDQMDAALDDILKQEAADAATKEQQEDAAKKEGSELTKVDPETTTETPAAGGGGGGGADTPPPTILEGTHIADAARNALNTAFETNNNVQIADGSEFTLDGPYSIPAGKSLTISGHLSTNSDITVESGGTLNNTAVDTLDMNSKNLILKDGSSFQNTGRVEECPIIIVAGSGVNISNSASKEYQLAEIRIDGECSASIINEMGSGIGLIINNGTLNLTNRGRVETLNNAADLHPAIAKISNQGTISEIDGSYEASTISQLSFSSVGTIGSGLPGDFQFYSAPGESASAVPETNVMYAWNTSVAGAERGGGWLKVSNQLKSADAATSLNYGAAFDNAFACYNEVMLSVSGELMPITPDNPITVPSGKTLIIQGGGASAFSLGAGVILHNYGKIQIGTASESSGLSEVSGTDIGNIVNTGTIEVVNGALTIQDNAEAGALGGIINIGSSGKLVVGDGTTKKAYVSGQINNTGEINVGVAGTDTRELILSGKAKLNNQGAINYRGSSHIVASGTEISIDSSGASEIVLDIPGGITITRLAGTAGVILKIKRYESGSTVQNTKFYYIWDGTLKESLSPEQRATYEWRDDAGGAGMPGWYLIRRESTTA